MNRKHFAPLFIAAGILCGVAAAPALTPATAAATVAAQSIVVKRNTPKPPKPKLEEFKGEVVRMDTISITVRDPKNSYLVRTFTFSPELAKKLQPLIDRGGYQSGDKVTIKFAEKSNVAQEIKGKASKAF